MTPPALRATSPRAAWGGKSNSLAVHRRHRAWRRRAATIDDVVGTGDVAGKVRAQEQDRVGDFLRRAVAADGNGRLVGRLDLPGIGRIQLLLQVMDHAGVDRAGTDR